MNKRIPTLFYIFALYIVTHPVAAVVKLKLEQGEMDLYTNSYALVIGISDYTHWPDLPGVRDDIKSVSAALKEHKFNVTTVLNPTRNEFDKAMRKFISIYGQGEENRLLIYYAGHGYTLKTSRGRELGYIIPKDTTTPDRGPGSLKQTAISMLEIEIYAKQMEAKHALFLFDSCFSGSLFEISRGVPASISERTAKPVRQFITAGSADQEVPDKSIFRRQFVAGLKGESDLNSDGYITGSELAQYLEDSVINYSHRAQTPQYGKIRDPILDKGDFVFIVPAKLTLDVNIKQKTAVNPLNVELMFWESIKNSNDPDQLAGYVKKYPAGEFVNIAKIKINKLTRPVDIGMPSITFSDAKIVLVPSGENSGKRTQMNDALFTQKIAQSLQQQIQNVLSNKGSIQLSIDKNNNKQYSSNDLKGNIDLCNNFNANYIVAGKVKIMDQKNTTPSLHLSYFDCNLKQKIDKNYKLSKYVKDAFQYQTTISSSSERFLTNYVKVLHDTAKTSENQAQTDKGKAKKRNMRPRW